MVVIYEDGATRDAAIHVCDSLMQNLEADLEFEFTWCKFKYLSYPVIARQTGQTAARADLILVSVRRAEDFSAEARAWLELWLSRRGSPGGGTIALVQTSAGAGEQTGAPNYLRLMAERANLDYLTLSGSEAASMFSIKAGEGRVVREVAEPDPIANHEPLSSGWGINE